MESHFILQMNPCIIEGKKYVFSIMREDWESTGLQLCLQYDFRQLFPNLM